MDEEEQQANDQGDPQHVHSPQENVKQKINLRRKNVRIGQYLGGF